MKKLIATVFWVTAVFVGYAQSLTLLGTVVDEKDKPIKGVTVYVKETGKNEIFTNSEGKFKLLVSDTAKQKTIVFFFSGYKKQEYPINSKEKNIRIVMKERVDVLEKEENIDSRGGGTGAGKSIKKSAVRKTISFSAPEIVSESSSKVSDVSVETDDKIGVPVPVRAERPTIIEVESTAMESRVSADKTRTMSGVTVIALDEIRESKAFDNINAGTLTSGEVNDFAKWHLWGDILKNKFQQYTNMWHFYPLRRYIAQLTNKAGMPLANAQVTLKNKNGDIFWQAKTDNTGKAELWFDFFKSETKTNTSDLKLVFEYEGKTTEITKITPFEQGINAAQLNVACKKRNKVDIFFMVDATGSMSDEIRYLQVELNDIIKKIHEQQSELQLRVGSLVYRDHGDEFLTRKSSLNSDINETLDFLRKQSAGGGGDYPEAVDVALYHSIASEDWDNEALARILFIVLDAPSHTNPENIALLESQLRLAAEMGIRIVPIACSDIQKDGEYLMRTFALATNGTYLFLTDHSGVGNAHIEPTTDKYEVEKLNDAIVRVVKQYTKIPNCDNSAWVEESKNTEPSDKFVPNPYDEQAEKDADKLTAADVIKIYPNPCSDVLKVEIKQSDVADIYLVDMTGKTLYGFKSPAKNIIDINVNTLSTGVYFVKAFYKGRWFSEKFVKN